MCIDLSVDAEHTRPREVARSYQLRPPVGIYSSMEQAKERDLSAATTE